MNMGTDRNIVWTRQIKRITRKLANTRSHIRFIETCLNRKVISTGFKTRWTPSFIVSNEEKIIIQSILEEASYKLMTETLNHNYEHARNLVKKRKSLWQEIRRVCTEEQQEMISQIVSKESGKTQTKIEKIKQKKLSYLDNLFNKDEKESNEIRENLRESNSMVSTVESVKK